MTLSLTDFDFSNFEEEFEHLIRKSATEYFQKSKLEHKFIRANEFQLDYAFCFPTKIVVDATRDNMISVSKLLIAAHINLQVSLVVSGLGIINNSYFTLRLPLDVDDLLVSFKYATIGGRIHASIDAHCKSVLKNAIFHFLSKLDFVF